MWSANAKHNLQLLDDEPLENMQVYLEKATADQKKEFNDSADKRKTLMHMVK